MNSSEKSELMLIQHVFALQETSLLESTTTSNQAAAEALEAQDVEVVKAELNNAVSLEVAFIGCCAVLAVTALFFLFASYGLYAKQAMEKKYTEPPILPILLLPISALLTSYGAHSRTLKK